MMPVAEDKLSLSIIFRISSAATDRLVQEEDLEVVKDSANQMATLDLVIPSHNDYELFVSTVRNLMTLNKKFASSMNRDILLLQYHWMEIGKQYSDKISQSEWTAICCDRLSTDIGRNAAVSMFRKYCKATKTNPDVGISLQNAVGLLEHTRTLSLLLNSASDPCNGVWDLLPVSGKGTKSLGTSHFLPNNFDSHVLDFNDDAAPGSNYTSLVEKAKVRKPLMKNVSEEHVSAKAFLRFLKEEQKDTNATLEDVRSIFERLNAQTYASQLGTDCIHRSSVDSSFSKDYITKTVFINYLRSDANDVFDPVRGEEKYDDLNEPLSSYWINASHNTFLKGTVPKMKQQINERNSVLDVSMYIDALNRGCRCLEAAVWDGVSTQKGEPVVRFDEPVNGGSGNSSKQGILFADVIKAMHSFLVSERNCLPIILIIEAHCNVSAQEKMSQIIHSILGKEDMLIVPNENDLKNGNLPSPNELRGKVVIKSKILAQGGSHALCDDFDHHNDVDPFAPISEDVFEGEGYNQNSDEFFGSSLDLSKDNSEVVKKATIMADRAKKAADAAEDKAFNTNVKMNRAQEFTDRMLEKAGITAEFAQRKLGKRSNAAAISVVNEDEAAHEESAHDVSSASVKTKAKSNQGSTKAVDSHDSGDEEGTHAAGTVASGSTVSTAASTVKTREQQKSIFDKFLNWANHFDGTASATGTYFEEEDRESAQSMAHSSSSDDSRDDGEEYDFDFDFDIAVDDFSPTNLMSELKASYQDLTIRKDEKEEKYRRAEEFKMQKRSISNVNRKLELQSNEHVDGGVEVQHFYSGTVDFALMEHKEAEEGVEKASRVLGVATTIFNKRQQEYEKVKPIERFYSIPDEIEQVTEKKRQGGTSASTARSEYQISEERAVETAENVERARTQRDEAQAAEDIVEKPYEAEKKAASLKEQIENCQKHVTMLKKKFALVMQEHKKVTEGIKVMEGSHRYKVEKKEASRGALSDGTALRKHRAEIEKQLMLNAKIQESRKKKNDFDQKLAEAEAELEEVEKELEEYVDSTAKAKEYSDKCDTYLEQMEQLAEEEKDAAKMREQASGKAEAALVVYDKQIQDLEREYDVLKNKMPDDFDKTNSLRICSKAKQKLDEAEINFRNAQETYKWADRKLKDADDTLNENSDALSKAKRDAEQLEYRMNADDALKEVAISVYESLETVKIEAQATKKQAVELRAIATSKATALRRAQDQSHRHIMVKEISPKLADLTLLGSSKLRYFEESLLLPVNNMHSISEGKMMQLLTNDASDNAYQFTEFNKNHLTRVFPSRQKKLRQHSTNFNPVLPWSLGCQIVSMNQQVCDAFVLVNDGRFRANGSCGYVLKPSSMLSMNNNRNVPKTQATWQFKILSGYNLPKTRKKAFAGCVNPRVRITLYDGGATDQVVYISETVKKNGLNPIWDEDKGTTFENIKDPDSAIIMLSVWDFNGDGAEDFIAAGAVPISCMRQGYRSVPLFDVNHMRCGAHAFTSLFIHSKAL